MSDPVTGESPAVRVKRLLDSAWAVQVESLAPHSAAVDGWGVVFGLGKPVTPPSHARDAEVMRLLAIAHTEVLRMENLLASQGVTIPRTVNEKLYGLLSPRALQNNWRDVLAQYTPDVVSSLEIFAQVLPQTDAVVPWGDLTEFAAQLRAFRESIRQGTLPENVKTFLLQQLDRIERALREYPIRGEAAFRDAADDIAGAWVSQPSEVQTNREAQADVQKVLTFWSAVAKWGRRVILVAKIATHLKVLGGDLADGASVALALLPPTGEGVQQNGEPGAR